MLKTLVLKEFRNHELLELNFSEHITLIVGENAQGKTNILEGIYLLGRGESLRAGKIEEMVAWDAEVAHVVGKGTGYGVRGAEDEVEVRATLTRGVYQGRKVAKRSFVVNGVGRRKADVAGLIPVVLFRPEDMDLITGNPNERRQFMDEVLVQVEREYGRSLVSYEKALRQRNRLLDLIRDGNVSRTALAFWDEVLIKEGNVLTRHREQFVEQVNQLPSLSGQLALVYDRSSISRQRLDQYEREELAVGYTLVGPHKDDFMVIDYENRPEGRDLALYGSRGEQRMAVLWLKEAQLSYMETALTERPLLLLDDILSELDKQHGARVVELARRQQTVLTTTETDATELFCGEARVVQL